MKDYILILTEDGKETTFNYSQISEDEFYKSVKANTCKTNDYECFLVNNGVRETITQSGPYQTL
jgi:hypothetical protein